MRNRKGFTFIELVVGIIALTIIVLVIGQLIYLLHSHLFLTTQQRIPGIAAQLALVHIIENIQQSAWVIVESPNKIVLYSHSKPIREYNFDNGKIMYTKEGDSPSLLAQELETDKAFEGAGTEWITNRYHMVKIKFWDKDSPESIAYAVAGCKENRNVVYVDPNSTSDGENGTKVSPYKTMQDALSGAPDNSYASTQGAGLYFIAFLSGEHEFLGDVEIKNNNHLVFCANSVLKIKPNANINVGGSSRITIGGKFYCDTSPNARAAIQGKIIETWEGTQLSQWDYIFVINDHDEDFVYDFHDIDFKYAGRGIRFRRVTSPKPMHVVFANNTFFDGWNQLYGRNLQSLNCHGNTFTDFSESIQLFLDNTRQFITPVPPGMYLFQPAQGDISYNVYFNKFSYGGGSGHAMRAYVRCGSGQDGIFNIYQNRFQYMSMPLFLIASDYKGRGKLTAEISNNMFFSGDGSSEFIDGQWFRKSYYFNAIWIAGSSYQNLNSSMRIKNNTFTGDGNQAGTAIYFKAVSGKNFITNNEIRDSANYAMRCYSVEDVVINNNLIHDNTKCFEVFRPDWIRYGTVESTLELKNNVIYDSGEIYCDADAGAISLVNNTLDRVSFNDITHRIDIKNSIVWGEPSIQYVNDDLLKRTNWSDIANVTPNPAKHIISEEPPFMDRANHEYHLNFSGMTEGEKDKWKGDNADEMGAYGGPEKTGWDDGIGVQLPLPE